MNSAQPQSNGEDGDKLCPNDRESLQPRINNGHLQAPTHEQELKEMDNLATMMIVCEFMEAFEKKDGDLTFHHTAIILRKGDEFFHAETKNQYKIKDDIPLDELNVEPIPIDHIWPLLPQPQDLTIAPDPLPINSYVKYLSFFGTIQQTRHCEKASK